MALHKYESDIKIIPNNQDVIYNYLSNFDNLAQYMSDELLEQINEKVPQIKVSNFEADNDSCRFSIAGMGQAEIRIIDREPSKTIKVASTGSLPIGITFWIQLLPSSPYETKMKLTLHAEMSMIIKMMLGKKLESGIDELANMIAKLPFH
ncbi:MAG: hypothetical protein ACK5IJ_02760 [Mangrovibacterium sp.]